MNYTEQPYFSEPFTANAIKNRDLRIISGYGEYGYIQKYTGERTIYAVLRKLEEERLQGKWAVIEYRAGKYSEELGGDELWINLQF